MLHFGKKMFLFSDIKEMKGDIYDNIEALIDISVFH
jgi:hypothetical protein